MQFKSMWNILKVLAEERGKLNIENNTSAIKDNE